MTRSDKPNDLDLLDEEILELLGSAPRPVPVSQDQLDRLRVRVMGTIDDERASTRSFITIRANEGSWVEIAPKTYKKVLAAADENGAETYLLKLDAGAEPDDHFHEHDEFCIVLSGDVTFNDVTLLEGDYHFAARGSSHRNASTRSGVTLYVQSVSA